MPSVFRTSPAGPSHPGFPNQGFPGVSPFTSPAVTIVQNTGDGGTEGTGVTLGNSGGVSGTAFAVVSAGASNTITFTETAAIHGRYGYLFTKGGTASSLVELRDVSVPDGATSFAIRGYLNMRDGLPTSAAGLGMQPRTATAQAGRYLVTTTGALQLQTAAAAVVTGNNVMVGGMVYRIEIQASGMNTAGFGVLSGQVYAQDSLTPLDTVTATGLTNLFLVDRIRFGDFGAVTLPNYLWDTMAIQIGSPAPIGPYQTAYGDLVYSGPGRSRKTFYVVRWRTRPAEPVITQIVAPAQPPFVPAAARSVLARSVAARRPRPAYAALAPTFLPPAAARARRAMPARVRPGTEAMPPFAQVVAPPAPIYPLTVLRPRRAQLGRIRRPAPMPVPVQVVVAPNPPYPVSTARPRRTALAARRRPPAVVIPPQVAAPSAPPYVDPGRTRRRALSVVLARRRPPTTVPDQAVPPFRGLLRRRLVGYVRRGDQAVAPFPPATVPNPVYPRQPVRRRLVQVLFRRPRPAPFPVQPGNPNITIPRPGTVEPGTRTGPGSGPGARGGPSAQPGVRSSSTGVPGVRRGGDNEPGTRSGPTISGGQ